MAVDLKVEELESELNRIKQNESNGFPLHPEQILFQDYKKELRISNVKILQNFFLWLNEYTIDLKICSHYERGILFRMFGKVQNQIKRTQPERNVLKETMLRSQQK